MEKEGDRERVRERETQKWQERGVEERGDGRNEEGNSIG